MRPRFPLLHQVITATTAVAAAAAAAATTATTTATAAVVAVGLNKIVFIHRNQKLNK